MKIKSKKHLNKCLIICLCLAFIASIFIVCINSLSYAEDDTSGATDTVPSYVTDDGNFEYFIRDNEVTISKYLKNGTEVTIPANIKGYTVTTIGNGAFERHYRLYKVTFPSTIKYICDNAFAYCDMIESISFPSSLERIGDRGFYMCDLLDRGIVKFNGNNLISIGEESFAYTGLSNTAAFPSSLQKIGVAAFAGCSSLTSKTDIKHPTNPDPLRNKDPYFVNGLSGKMTSGSISVSCSNSKPLTITET